MKSIEVILSKLVINKINSNEINYYPIANQFKCFLIVTIFSVDNNCLIIK